MLSSVLRIFTHTLVCSNYPKWERIKTWKLTNYKIYIFSLCAVYAFPQHTHELINNNGEEKEDIRSGWISFHCAEWKENKYACIRVSSFDHHSFSEGVCGKCFKKEEEWYEGRSWCRVEAAAFYEALDCVCCHKCELRWISYGLCENQSLKDSDCELRRTFTGWNKKSGHQQKNLG